LAAPGGNCRILAINPGSTSTKVGYFEQEQPVWFEEISHDAQELAAFPTIAAQLPLRQAALERVLAQHNLDFGSLTASTHRISEHRWPRRWRVRDIAPRSSWTPS
jgi:butyrate kinase